MQGIRADLIYSEAFSHKIYAACDAFLMPSLFEPCGLSQLIALRYGTVPIVRETGGLKDTVVPYNEYENTGTGFSFRNYNAHEMMKIIRYAESVYYDNRRRWNQLVERGMKQDFSWNVSAKKYRETVRSAHLIFSITANGEKAADLSAAFSPFQTDSICNQRDEF